MIFFQTKFAFILELAIWLAERKPIEMQEINRINIPLGMKTALVLPISPYSNLF